MPAGTVPVSGAEPAFFWRLRLGTGTCYVSQPILSGDSLKIRVNTLRNPPQFLPAVSDYIVLECSMEGDKQNSVISDKSWKNICCDCFANSIVEGGG